MGDSKQVSEVRFNEYKNYWVISEIGKITNTYSGGTPTVGNSKYYNGLIPFIRSAEINSFSTELFITDFGLRSSSAKLVRKGDILYALYGATSGEVGRSNLSGAINQAILAIIPNTGYDAEFISQLLRKQKPKIIGTYLQGGQGNLSGSIIKDLKIAIPCIDEQTKIGELFKNLDTLINQHQTRVAQLANVKKSMLDKMFPTAGADVPEVRFGGFVERWRLYKFEDTVTFYNGLTYSPNDVQEKSGTLVLRSSNVKHGEIINADNVYVNSEVINCDFVQQGDIVVVVRNGSRSLIGKHAQVKSTIPNTVIGAFMTGIRSKQPSFINALLDTSLFYQEVEKCLGATINQITQGMFKKMHFMIPVNENEMTLIGNYFQNLDTLIAQNQKALNQLKNLKQALLHKMFV